MDWNFSTIGILLAVLFLGYFIGLLETYIRKSIKSKQATDIEQNEQPSTKEGETSVLRLSISSDQQLNLDMDGMRLASPTEITPDQRRRLISLLVRIRPWVEGGPVSPAPESVKSSAAPAAEQPSAKKSPVIKEPAATPPLQTKSIVVQIDDILQTRIAGTQLASKGIRLQEAPGGGVLVWIGMNRYESVDSVPDSEVVAAIRAATEEWEKKQ